MIRFTAIGDGVEKRISADPVVLAVSADHAPVESHVPGPEGRNSFQLCADKILLLYVIPVLEEFEHAFLDRVPVLSRQRDGAEEKDELFSFDRLGEPLFFLAFPGKVREKVVDGKDRLIAIFADNDVYRPSVCLDDDTVKSKGNRHPVVFFYTAVVVGPEQGDVDVLVEGVLFQVEPWCIDMGGDDPESVGDGLSSPDKCHDFLISVDGKGPVRAKVVGKAPAEKIIPDIRGRLPFRLGQIEKGFVP